MRSFGTEFKLLVLVLGLLFVASYALSAEEEVILGKVRYDVTTSLTDQARLEVALINTTAKDVASKVVVSDVLPAGNTGETEFVLEYQPSDINPQSEYAIQARIFDAGKLAFINTTQHAVLTQGFSEKVDLQLKHLHHVASSEAAKTTLQGDAWRLVAFGDADLSDDVKSTLVINDEGHVSGSGGCNVYTGKAKIDGAKLSFSPLAGTRKLCPESIMSQEDAFFKMLSVVSSYAIEKKELLLKDADGKTLLRLKQTS
ncbi:MAG: META domain-containing protein [Hyphomicrobiales bacterium]